MGLFDSLKEAFESDPQKLADWEKDLTELQGKLASASGDEAAKIQAEIDAKTQAIAGLKSKMGVETPVTLPAEVTEPETLPAPEEVLPEPVTPEVPSEPETVTPEVPSEPAPEPVPQPQPVVEAGGSVIIHVQRPHCEQQPPVAQQRVLLEAARTQPFGSGAFHELQVIGVVDHAATISIFVINPDGPDKGFHLPLKFHPK